MPVVYRGIRPGNFKDAISIVAIGRYHDNRIEAEKLLVKCPSKYQGAEVEKAYSSATRSGESRLLTAPMYVWPGVFAIWSALVAGLASAVTYWRVDRGRRDLLPFARTTYLAFTVSVVTSAAILMTLLLQHRFDVVLRQLVLEPRPADALPRSRPSGPARRARFCCGASGDRSSASSSGAAPRSRKRR